MNIIKSKQTLYDIGVVLALPLLVFIGSYFWTPSNDTALLSVVAPSTDSGFGAKGKAALDTLNSIAMDTSVFSNPVYQSLQEFHVDVAPATLGRAYPFTPSGAVRIIEGIKAQ